MVPPKGARKETEGELSNDGTSNGKSEEIVWKKVALERFILRHPAHLYNLLSESTTNPKEIKLTFFLYNFLSLCA